MKVEVFFDVASVYSFFAFEILERYRQAWSLDIHYRPFFLGGVMVASGNKPPATVPLKGAYVPRCSDFYKLRVIIPSAFPINTLQAMRVITATQEKFPDKLVTTIRLLFEAVYQDDKDIGQKDVLLQVLENSKFTKDELETVVSRANSVDIKQKVKASSDEAVARGAFGAPTMFWKKDDSSTEEMVFGSDRFPIIAHMYGLSFNGAYPANAKL